MFTKENIRNVAIIAHVDHGKTTLVDAFLKQSNIFRENQAEMSTEAILDSGDLEREKGITIKAKHASVIYKDVKINIIDTPGHSDFGGEVERTLNMADGCLLVVDAQEGPMPQTKFVLKKALETGLKPIVVINKIDKPYADPAKALDKVNDLFLSLVDNLDQLDFPVFYAVGRDGKAFTDIPEDIQNTEATIEPLLRAIVEKIPSPTGNENEPFQMLITTLDYDAHLGRLLVGKIRRGKIKVKNSLAVVDDGQVRQKGQVKNIFIRKGLTYDEVLAAQAGELVAIAGIDSTDIGFTLCDPNHPDSLPRIALTPPSVQAKFEANSSPFLGRDGEFVTAKQLQQRLEKEQELNIGLEISKTDGGGFIVAGRGELQLAILIEELRREGFELQVRRPEVILRKDNEGDTTEPLEELYIEAPEEYQGGVITAVSERKGEMKNLEVENGTAKMTYEILTRNLLGLRNELLTMTKGTSIMSSFVKEYVKFDKSIPEIYRKGVIISTETGPAAAYALNTAQERGDLFIKPADEIYEGMIVGINKFDQDIEINVCKEREKSGVRRSTAEITQVQLKTPFKLTLEFALVFLAKDEILEITPNHLRLRKQYLKKHERVWANRGNLTDFAKSQMGK